MENQIIQEYLAGKSISQLSKEYPFSYRKITNLLIDNNITIRGGRKKKNLSPEQLNILKNKYEKGNTLEELKKEFNLDKDTLKRIIKENNFKRKNHNRVNKRILSDYFSNIDTPEKAYWLGLLFTDGSVDHYGKTGRIRLQLKNEDEELLEQFKQDLQLDCSIIYDKRPGKLCCSVEFTDEQIYQDLSKYGIVPNKTYECKHIYTELIPDAYKTAFALGLFDGDGCLTYSDNFSKDVTFNFTSYYESTVQDFQKLIDSLIKKDSHNKNIYTSAWHTVWRGRKQVLQILDILYNNCPRHLARKYNKYLLLKNSLN